MPCPYVVMTTRLRDYGHWPESGINTKNRDDWRSDREAHRRHRVAPNGAGSYLAAADDRYAVADAVVADSSGSQAVIGGCKLSQPRAGENTASRNVISKCDICWSGLAL